MKFTHKIKITCEESDNCTDLIITELRNSGIVLNAENYVNIAHNKNNHKIRLFLKDESKTEQQIKQLLQSAESNLTQKIIDTKQERKNKKTHLEQLEKKLSKSHPEIMEYLKLTLSNKGQ